MAAERYDISGRDRNRDRDDRDRDRDRERRFEDWNREWNRDRDREYAANEGRFGEARYENYGNRSQGNDDWRENRQYDAERGDYNNRGDWGRQGSWGNYGNRPDYHREDWRENRGIDWGAERSDFGGARSGRTQLFGTGGGGFGTGFSSYGAATGPYGGGMGSYGERSGGRHAGRGPKGWQRSDDRIREDINERLTDHPHVDASEIEVQVSNGEVTLSGTVDERHAKRLAEDIAESVSGVRDVHNQIRVQGQSANQQGGFETRGTGSTPSRTK